MRLESIYNRNNMRDLQHANSDLENWISTRSRGKESLETDSDIEQLSKRGRDYRFFSYTISYI